MSEAALAIALKAKKTLPALSRRKSVNIVVEGQSTEQGPVYRTSQELYPRAFKSQRNPGFTVPKNRRVPQINRGGYWPVVYDALWDAGYDPNIFIEAVGGVSLLTHICGFVQQRTNSTSYYQKRTNGLYPDRGDFGDVVQIGTKFFVPTIAGKRQVYNSGPHPGVVGTSNFQDYVAFEQGAATTGTSAPDVSAVTVGQTITDGGITFTCVDAGSGRYGAEGSFYPGIDAAVNAGAMNYCFSGIMGERNAGLGFDPLGIIGSAWETLMSLPPAELTIVYFSQGQTDLGTGSVTYQRALQILANFFLARNVIVMIGTTTWSPASSGATAANYGLQKTGADNAVAALQALKATYPQYGSCYRGADLYTPYFNDARVRGQKAVGGTGGVSSATFTVASVSAFGNGIAVGQKLYVNNSQAVAATVQSIGTFNGASGTVTLDAAVTVGAGTSVIFAATGLQFDGVHYSGLMAVDYGTTVANSFLAENGGPLPRLPVL
ncbi:MAG TPA: hypothetical protein VF463_10470 [Sphingobium sp.]